MNLPHSENVPNTACNLSYVFIGDEALSFQADLLKPFNQRELTPDTIGITYFLNTAHTVMENAFGILVARFKALQVSKILLIFECYGNYFPVVFNA